MNKYVFSIGNYLHEVPVGYTLKETTSKGLNWVILRKDGKDIVSISERPIPLRSYKYRVYLHSYPDRTIDVTADPALYRLFLSSPSNRIIPSDDVIKYIFSTDNVSDYSGLIDAFFEHRTGVSDDINTPIKPKRVVNDAQITRYICGRCNSSFIKSPRCPECGQLMDCSGSLLIETNTNDTICVGDSVSGLKIYEIINKYFGEHYKGWMKAGYDINNDYWAWFPTITASNTRPNGSYGGSVMWSNTVTDDKRTVISMNHDATIDDLQEEERRNPFRKRRVLIFARIDGSFEFLGIFNDRIVLENEVLTFRHDRIAKGIDLTNFQLIEEESNE